MYKLSICLEICFKELPHAVVGACISKICRADRSKFKAHKKCIMSPIIDVYKGVM